MQDRNSRIAFRRSERVLCLVLAWFTAGLVKSFAAVPCGSLMRPLMPRAVFIQLLDIAQLQILFDVYGDQKLFCPKGVNGGVT